jgi:hypothetical protein
MQYFYAVKGIETKECTTSPHMNYYTLERSDYDAWLSAGSRKLKKGASAADAEVSTEIVRTYGEIAGRYIMELNFGISRLHYEPRKRGTNIFQGGYFANNQWSLRLELQGSQPSNHEIWAHEMACTDAGGYFMGLQQTAYSIINKNIAGETTDEARRDRSKDWAGRGMDPNLRRVCAWVLAIRFEFYRNSVTDPVSMRANQHIIEEDSHLPYSESMDERSKQIENLRESHLMKAFAALSASKEVTRGGGGASE